MHIITALPVGNLARVMTPVSRLETPCEICASFTEEQLIRISQRKHYVKKQKRDTTSSKDNELDLLGDDVDSFTGSHADLESAADNLFTSLLRPQPLPFSSLSIKTPAKTVPPTPGTALQQKIEFYGNHLAVDPPLVLLIWTYPLRDLELPHMSRKWKWTMVLHFLHVSVLTLITYQIRILIHPRSLLRRPQIDLKNTLTKGIDVEPRSASDQYYDESDEPRIPSSKPKKHADKSRHNVRSRYISASSEEDQSSVARHRSSKPSGALSDQD